MDRRTFLSGVGLSVLAASPSAQSLSAPRAVRIGILSLRPLADRSAINDALMGGLRERGYVEGKSMVVDYPDALGRDDRLPELAAELVRRKPDVILVIGPAPLEPARRATKTVPLVMVASSADPVAEGVAASLARPGGNVTGLTYAEPDRFKKQLELLKAAAPRVVRVAVLWDFDTDVYRRFWEAPLKEAGRILGLAILEPVRVRNAGELPVAFALVRQRQGDAILVAAGGIHLAARKEIGDLALRHRLPGIAAFKEFPQAGLLMSYGPDLADINRRAGGFVDRILKGAKPGDLPIELPNKFDLAINLGTAKALGLEIDQSLRYRASELIP